MSLLVLLRNPPQTVSVGVLGGGATFAPTVHLSVAIGLIDQSGVTFEPTLAVGGVSVEPEVLGGGQAFAPVIGDEPAPAVFLTGGSRRNDIIVPPQPRLSPQPQAVRLGTLGGTRIHAPAVSVEENEDWVIDPALFALV